MLLSLRLLRVPCVMYMYRMMLKLHARTARSCTGVHHALMLMLHIACTGLSLTSIQPDAHHAHEQQHRQDAEERRVNLQAMTHVKNKLRMNNALMQISRSQMEVRERACARMSCARVTWQDLSVGVASHARW